MKFSTKLIHNGNAIDPFTGAVSIPIYQTSTYHQEDLDNPSAYEYSRSGNPTRQALENIMTQLEGGSNAYAFASGMAATAAALSIFSSGDHIICCQDVYGGTFRAVEKIFSRFGISHSFVDATDLDEIRGAIKFNTVAIFIETPSNPLLRITDIRGVVQIAKDHNLTTIIDNTFMSPYLQRPIEFGVDIIVHSGTKFLSGHSDVLSGIVVTANHDLGKRIYAIQNGLGGVLGPQDCWLMMRGLKTLKVRMDEQQKVAGLLANWFSNSSAVEKVFYPGLAEHAGSKIHFGQSDGPGAVLSVDFGSGARARHFMSHTSLAAVAVSLGGVETIISYPEMMSHASMPKAERDRLGITEGLVRISAGIEDSSDLISDFENAITGI
jgi:cystathionine beta-lyase/cystathionine gamma-synthase